MKRWLSEGPSIEEIVAERKDDRVGKRRKAALLIPTINNYNILKNHVEELKKQTFQDFDIIIIYTESDNFIETDGSSILHVRERGNSGPAGKFYIGEKMAIEEGYPVVIHADDDCFPKSDDLLEKLVMALEKGEDVVFPMMTYGTSKTGKGTVINHYGSCRTSVFKKSGLAFLPMRIGWEDSELRARIKQNGFRISHVDARAWHPYIMSTFIERSERTYYYRRGSIEESLLRKHYFWLYYYIIFELLIIAASLALGKINRAKVVFSALWDGTGMKFFEVDRFHGKDKHRKTQDFVCIADNIDKSRYDVVVEMVSTKKILTSLMEFFGKRILIVEGRETHKTTNHLPIMIVSKSTDIIFQNRVYRLTEERNIFAIILGIMICIIAVPFIPLAGVLFFIRGYIMKGYTGISSDGYGL